MYWALGAVALAAGGTYYYMNNESFAAAQKPFVPTKEDYQKVYDEIAHLLVEKDDYDDGSYGPVSLSPFLYCLPGDTYEGQWLISPCFR